MLIDWVISTIMTKEKSYFASNGYNSLFYHIIDKKEGILELIFIVFPIISKRVIICTPIEIFMEFFIILTIVCYWVVFQVRTMQIKMCRIFIYSILFDRKTTINYSVPCALQKLDNKQKRRSRELLSIFWIVFLLSVSSFHEYTLKKPIHGIKIPQHKKTKLVLECFRIIVIESIGCINESLTQGRSYYESNISVVDCVFSRTLTYDGDGGVIYVFIGSKYNMNVSYSMFSNIVSSGKAGAIFFSSQSSSIKMNCAYRCSCGATKMGQFAFLQTSMENQVDYLSVTQCSYTTNGIYTVYLSQGYEIVDNTNNSMNWAIMCSGLYVISPSKFTSSFCTFANNKVSESVCVYFSSNSGNMSYANIVHNNSPLTNGVVYIWGGFPKMFHCIFDNNQNTLFNILSGSLTIFNSFISHSSTLSSGTTVSITNNNNSIDLDIPLEIRQTYQFQFYNSFFCYADDPLPIQTPLNTIEKTPMNTIEATPMSTFEETLMDTIEATPMSSFEETPMNTFKETLMETIEETPMNTFEETPMSTFEETPMSTFEETPMSTFEETPMNTFKETLMETIEETPMNSFEETLMETIEETLMNTFKETPMSTFEETLMETIEETRMNTFEETPMSTFEETLMETIEETPMNTFKETPMNTFEETLMSTFKETPMSTFVATQLKTYEVTPLKTFEATLMDTFEETPMSTYEETLMNDIGKTPIITSQDTPMNSFKEAKMNTPCESPLNTKADTNGVQWIIGGLGNIIQESTGLFVFIVVLVFVLIFIFVFVCLYRKQSITDSSSTISSFSVNSLWISNT